MSLERPATLLSQPGFLVLGTCALALVFGPPLPGLLQILLVVLVWHSFRSYGNLVRLLRGEWRGIGVQIVVLWFRRRRPIGRLSLLLMERLETRVLAVSAR